MEEFRPEKKDIPAEFRRARPKSPVAGPVARPALATTSLPIGRSDGVKADRPILGDIAEKHKENYTAAGHPHDVLDGRANARYEFIEEETVLPLVEAK